MIRPVLLLAALWLGAATGGAAEDDILARHESCAREGRESAACAEIVTGHCLSRSRNVRALTRCRARMARAMEFRAGEVTERIGARAPHMRGRAAEIAAGSDRIVAAYCAGFAGRMASDGAEAHDIRCALMTAHVKLYHLIRLESGLDVDI